MCSCGCAHAAVVPDGVYQCPSMQVGGVCIPPPHPPLPSPQGHLQGRTREQRAAAWGHPVGWCTALYTHERQTPKGKGGG